VIAGGRPGGWLSLQSSLGVGMAPGLAGLDEESSRVESHWTGWVSRQGEWHDISTSIQSEEAFLHGSPPVVQQYMLSTQGHLLNAFTLKERHGKRAR